MSEIKPGTGFTPGPWKWHPYGGYHFLCGDTKTPDGEFPKHIVHSDGSACGEYSADIDVSSPDAILIAAAPSLFDYAEAEEKEHRLWELGESCFRGDGPTIADYFEALERDFPEVAAKCPLLSEEAILEWFGEAIEPIWARWNMYYLGEGEESIGWILGEHLIALRTAALTKARGEAKP